MQFKNENYLPMLRNRFHCFHSSFHGRLHGRKEAMARPAQKRNRTNIDANA